MHDIIEKIVEIDAKAKDIEAEGIKLKEQAQIEVENEKKRASEERLARAERRIEMIRASEESFANEKIARLTAEHDMVRDRLQKSFEEKHAQWENEIFDRVLGR